jgi:hypothetical protein
MAAHAENRWLWCGVCRCERSHALRWQEDGMGNVTHTICTCSKCGARKTPPPAARV